MRLTLIALLLAGVEGCDPTPEENFEATRKAAEQGDASAQFNLGWMYAEGEGVPENHMQAVKWYRKAAEQGDAGAQLFLGRMYDEGGGGRFEITERRFKGVPKDNAEAVKWHRKAAEQGDAAAQWGLGLAYRYGDGVPEDPAEAYAWMAVATANGAGPDAVEFRDRIKRDLSPARLAQAQQRARELFAAYAKKAD